jgi:hypothetical protein
MSIAPSEESLAMFRRKDWDAERDDESIHAEDRFVENTKQKIKARIDNALAQTSHLKAGSDENLLSQALTAIRRLEEFPLTHTAPVPMLLICPSCGERHVDEGEFATKRHHTHACQHCGTVWRPAIVDTVGVQFLPGYKNTATP